MNNKLTEVEFNALVEQCIKSGFFKSRENAERYVLKNCQPEEEIVYVDGEDVFTDNEVVESKYVKWLD